MKSWESLTGIRINTTQSGDSWKATVDHKTTRNRKEVKLEGTGDTPDQARDDLILKARGCIVETPRGNFNTPWVCQVPKAPR